MRIRTKFVLIMMIFLFIVFAIMYLIFSQISQNRAIENINNHINTAVKFKAQNIESLLENYKNITELLAGGVPVIQYFDTTIDHKTREKNFKSRISNSIKINDAITRIRILDVKGIVTASSHEDIGMDSSNSKIFLEGKKGTYIGDLHFSEFTGEYVLSISDPIYANGKISGVFIINFAAAKQLFPIIADKTGLAHSTDIYLLNKDHYLISPLPYEDKILERKIEPEQINLCYSDHIENKIPEMDLKELMPYNNYLGKKVLGTHSYISLLKWFLIVEVNEAEFMRPVIKYRNILLITFSIILILSLGVSYIFSIFLTKPIKRLEAGVQEIINGNTDYKVATKRKDEIGHLSRVFDDMTVKLNKSQKELENHAEKLEVQVKERTTELEKKIDESKQQRHAILNVAADLEKINVDLKAEITERKRAEEQIKKDLKIKTALLQELYHRTKNNMQLIASMLKMQSRSIENRSLAGISSIDFLHDSFDAIINRIKAMSMVHQKLYQAEDLSRINLKEYIKDLVNYLMMSYHIRSETISVNLELEDVLVLIDSAIPMSLVLNELISNVFKHAFLNNAKGELSIRLFKDKIDFINIQLSDNGIGIPKDIELKNVNTIGLQTVFNLIQQQLNGQIRYDTEKGLKWHFKFKDNLHEVRV